MTALIPLYAIGVFLSFTLSQAGMARRWWNVGHLAPGEEVKEPGSRCATSLAGAQDVINGFGAVATAIVCRIFATTKFQDGAWIIVVLIPVLVFIFFGIHRHYKRLAKQLSLEQYDTRRG